MVISLSVKVACGCAFVGKYTVRPFVVNECVEYSSVGVVAASEVVQSSAIRSVCSDIKARIRAIVCSGEESFIFCGRDRRTMVVAGCAFDIGQKCTYSRSSKFYSGVVGR